MGQCDDKAEQVVPVRGGVWRRLGVVVEGQGSGIAHDEVPDDRHHRAFVGIGHVATKARRPLLSLLGRVVVSQNRDATGDIGRSHPPKHKGRRRRVRCQPDLDLVALHTSEGSAGSSTAKSAA